MSHQGQAIPFASAEALREGVRRKNDQYRTMLTVHDVRVQIKLQDGEYEKRTFRGVLAIKRPDSFRLYILGPMGIRLVDLLRADGRTRVLHVAKTLKASSRLPGILRSIAVDIREIYRLAPARRVSRREVVERRARGRTRYLLREYHRRALTREIAIHAASLAVASARVTSPDGGKRIIRYTDHREVGGILAPRTIRLGKTGKVKYDLTINVSSIKIDPKLPRDVFLTEDGGRG